MKFLSFIPQIYKDSSWRDRVIFVEFEADGAPEEQNELEELETILSGDFGAGIGQILSEDLSPVEQLEVVEEKARDRVSASFKHMYQDRYLGGQNREELELRVNNVVEKFRHLISETSGSDAFRMDSFFTYVSTINSFYSQKRKQNKNLFEPAENAGEILKIKSQGIITSWLESNSYTFIQGESKREVIIWQNGKALTVVPNGIIEMLPVFDERGRIKGIVTIDGDGDMASRFGEGSMHFMEQKPGQIESGFVGKPGNIKKSQFFVEESGLKKRLVNLDVEHYGSEAIGDLVEKTTGAVEEAMAAPPETPSPSPPESPLQPPENDVPDSSQGETGGEPLPEGSWGTGGGVEGSFAQPMFPPASVSMTLGDDFRGIVTESEELEEPENELVDFLCEGGRKIKVLPELAEKLELLREFLDFEKLRSSEGKITDLCFENGAKVKTPEQREALISIANLEGGIVLSKQAMEALENLVIKDSELVDLALNGAILIKEGREDFYFKDNLPFIRFKISWEKWANDRRVHLKPNRNWKINKSRSWIPVYGFSRTGDFIDEEFCREEEKKREAQGEIDRKIESIEDEALKTAIKGIRRAIDKSEKIEVEEGRIKFLNAHAVDSKVQRLHLQTVINLLETEEDRKVSDICAGGLKKISIKNFRVDYIAFNPDALFKNSGKNRILFEECGIHRGFSIWAYEETEGKEKKGRPKNKAKVEFHDEKWWVIKGKKEVQVFGVNQQGFVYEDPTSQKAKKKKRGKKKFIFPEDDNPFILSTDRGREQLDAFEKAEEIQFPIAFRGRLKKVEKTPSGVIKIHLSGDLTEDEEFDFTELQKTTNGKVKEILIAGKKGESQLSLGENGYHENNSGQVVSGYSNGRLSG